MWKIIGIVLVVLFIIALIGGLILSWALKKIIEEEEQEEREESEEAN